MKFAEMKERLGNIVLYHYEGNDELEVAGTIPDDATRLDAARMVIDAINRSVAEAGFTEENATDAVWPEGIPETDNGDMWDDGLTLYHPNGCQVVILVDYEYWRIEGLYNPGDPDAESAAWRALSANEAHELLAFQIARGDVDPATGLDIDPFA
jgi:hypothetical protein